MRDQLPFFSKTWLYIGVKFFRSETKFPVLFSPPLPSFFFCSAAADMSWFIIKRQAKKPLQIIPELRTYNSNVTLWHSLRTHWTHHPYHFYRCSYVFEIPGKYQWWLMVSFDWVRQQEAWEHHKAACCRQIKMETFQFSCRISWAI